MRIYLDSAPLIYLVENIVPYASNLAARLAAPDVNQVCSELSRLECRVKPIRDREATLLTAFDNYFTGIMSEVLPLTRPIIDLATELRACYKFKAPDAIHLAAAIHSGCDLFLTNDYRLEKCREITVEIVAS
ncbi:MAG TPA: type II toxin-antitoxin system VapC family toxin [Thermoflexia bacterium]|nr:type II toxin-antitoxin system VapC family toxin [Thermoflexia bacterium]